MFPFEIKKMEQYLTNIFSFAAVVYKLRITIDKELDSSIKVNIENDTSIMFNQCEGGLYYYDTTNEEFGKGQTTDYTFLSTVKSNKSCLHRWEIKDAEESRILQTLVRWLPT